MTIGDDEPLQRRPTLAPPSLDALLVLGYGLFGALFGARPISDNSAFIHIRTGIEILSAGAVPKADPYSFTAGGEPWVVQSWLVSAAYGSAHRLAGFEGVVALNALLTTVLAALVVRLARTGSMLWSAAAGTAAVFVGVVYWSPRPLLVGLICLALLILVVHERRSALWLLPVMWVWVNSHGSFPLGLAWLGLYALGTLLDERTTSSVTALMRYGVVFLGGLAVAMVNPFGPRLLAFPAIVLERHEIFRAIVEWRSPDFGRPGGLVALGAIAVSLVVLVRRPAAWRYALPAVAFLAAGLAAQRNIAVAGVVLAPALGAALAPVTRTSDARASRTFHWAIAAGMVVLALAAVATVWTRPPLRLVGYPVAAVSALEERGVIDGENRLVHEDTVGGYLILRRGSDANVFVDDRAELYPAAVVRDLIALQRGNRVVAILDRRAADAVLWERRSAVADLLAADADWERVYRDDDWVAFVRRGRS